MSKKNNRVEAVEEVSAEAVAEEVVATPEVEVEESVENVAEVGDVPAEAKEVMDKNQVNVNGALQYAPKA